MTPPQEHSRSYIAFVGTKRIAEGDLLKVTQTAKALWDQEKWASVLVFDTLTSEVIDIDYSGTLEDVLGRVAEMAAIPVPSGTSIESEEMRSTGSPRLGVVAREVTLLPRHWDWLASQPGGVSVALRKLVEQARLANRGHDRRRRAQESTYRFLSAMAGDESGFEEAIRALFAGDEQRFDQFVEPWPKDIRDHAKKLASVAFANSETPPSVG